MLVSRDLSPKSTGENQSVSCCERNIELRERISNVRKSLNITNLPVAGKGRKRNDLKRLK